MTEQEQRSGVSASRQWARWLAERKWFHQVVIVLIVVNAVILGLETYSAATTRWGPLLETLNTAIVAVFVAELALRLYAYGWSFFRSGWNIFDFIVVIAALVPASSTSAALRLLRLLRVFRLLSAVRSMRMVIGALGSSIPGILSMGALFMMVLYVFAIASTTLFAPYDPENYGDLGRTFASLYRIVIGDGWSDTVLPIAEQLPWVWAYFIGFSLIGAVVLLNLFVAVVVQAMNRMQTEEEAEQGQHVNDQRIDTVLAELRELRAAISRLDAGYQPGQHFPEATQVQ